MLRALSSVRSALIVLAALSLAACASIPYADDRTVPTPLVVADASPERMALNARVYDSSVAWVAQRFYKRDFGGVDWLAQAAERREAAIAQPTETAFYGALNQTLQRLGDAHTNATTPTRHRERAVARLQARPNIGFTMRIVEEQFIVTYVRPDSPASETGVQVGWRVESVDGQQASRELKLDKRSEHTLVFTDMDGMTHTVTIPERDLPPYVGQAYRRDDGVLVLSFDYFSKVTREWFEARMREAVADPPTGIVVDLRDNTGGLLSDVGRTLSPLFAEPQPYAYVEYGYLPRFPSRTRRWRHIYSGPVAVLISDRSASGAEVFAATLQETGRGPVLGIKSPGFVIASRQVDLPDGGELSIGVRGFRSGQGRVLDGVGVTPDVEVKMNVTDLRAGRDPMIEAAAARLLSSSVVSP